VEQAALRPVEQRQLNSSHHGYLDLDRTLASPSLARSRSRMAMAMARRGRGTKRLAPASGTRVRPRRFVAPRGYETSRGARAGAARRAITRHRLLVLGLSITWKTHRLTSSPTG
jgi:hypothetical protein